MNKEEVKKAIDKFIKEVIPLLGEEGQILIIAYSENNYLSSGYSCIACSNLAAAQFILKHSGAEHTLRSECEKIH